MRQRKPLARRAGLKTNTPLRATKPIKRTGITPGSSVQPKRAPMKPWKPTKTAEESNGRRTVQLRSLVGDVRMCEITIPGVCTGQASEWHHRLNRSQCGTWEPANGLDACHRCHQAVTDTRPEHYDAGWCVKSWDNPLTRPVLRRGVWVLLDNDGGITTAGKEAAA